MTTDLGTIVNEREGQESTVSLDEARINLRVSNQIFDRLMKAAQFHNFPNLEAYCTARLIESLQTKIGAAYIDSPHALNGGEAQKVTGPSNSGMVTRA